MELPAILALIVFGGIAVTALWFEVRRRRSRSATSGDDGTTALFAAGSTAGGSGDCSAGDSSGDGGSCGGDGGGS